MTPKAIAPLILALVLGSCSSAHDLRAIVIDGKVAFVPEDKDIWGNPDPDCFYSISVSIIDGPPATPAARDSVGMVKNGVYWHRTFAVTSCDNAFPVIYGARLHGPPFRENEQSEVQAKPLRRGFTYEVSAASNGSEYGGRKFRLTNEAAVENLPR